VDIITHRSRDVDGVTTESDSLDGDNNYYEAGFAIGDLLAIYCFDTPNASLMELLADVPATYTDCGLKD